MTGGCFTCWRMCELLVADAPRWSYWCQDDIPDTQCSSGCHTACDFIINMETVYYAEELMDTEKTQVDFYNDSALSFSVHNPLPKAHLSWGVVFLVYYKHASNNHWTFFLSTFELHFPIYGKYKMYTNLVFQIKAVSEEGVVSMDEVDIAHLLSVSPSSTQKSSESPSVYTISTSEAVSTEIPVTTESQTSEQVSIITNLLYPSGAPAAATYSTVQASTGPSGMSTVPVIPTAYKTQAMSTEEPHIDSQTTELPPLNSLTTLDIAAVVVICANLVILAAAFLFFYIYIRQRSLSANSLSSTCSSLPRLDLTDLEKCALSPSSRMRPLASSSTVTSLTDLDKCQVGGSFLDLTKVISGYRDTDEVISAFNFTSGRKDEVCSLNEESV